MAMPWSRAKAIAAEYRSGVHDVKKLNALFDACFRIQREACEAAGRHIPLVVENVRGAQPWVGRSRWNFGSYHLWGDVPALMPSVSPRAILTRLWSEREVQRLCDATKNNGGSWFKPRTSSHSSIARKAASAKIAKIPLTLSRYIAQTFKPQGSAI